MRLSQNPWRQEKNIGKNVLDGWSLVKQQASVMAADPWQSLLHFQADCTVHIIYDPEHRSAMTFKFLKGDKEVLSIDGNTRVGIWCEKQFTFLRRLSTEQLRYHRHRI